MYRKAIFGILVIILTAASGCAKATGSANHALSPDYGYLAVFSEEVLSLERGDMVIMRDGTIYRVEETDSQAVYVRSVSGGKFPIYLEVNHQLYQILRLVKKQDDDYPNAAARFVNQG